MLYCQHASIEKHMTTNEGRVKWQRAAERTGQKEELLHGMAMDNESDQRN